MTANLSTLFRSLLAGDSERVPAAYVLHRLQAGSFIRAHPRYQRGNPPPQSKIGNRESKIRAPPHSSSSTFQ
ncbi:MAG: hypothetical protein RLZZ129_306 [Verrucomicrobiota bacterium]|jgi:hypothetical protein